MDHVDGLPLYPKARFLMQRRQYQWIVEKAPRYRVLNKISHAVPTSEIIENLVQLYHEGRLTLLDGEKQVVPGVKIVDVDGHYPGHQLLEVLTPKGLVVLASGCTYLYENVEQEIPTGMFITSVTDVIDAYRRMKQSGAPIIPAHDPEVMKRYPSVAKGIAKIE
jgi:glyoxylase-like metal-dependent hydrolase (beta-lactamase superfamily II)